MSQALRVPVPGLSKLLRRSLISAAVGIGITFLATFSVTLDLRLRLLVYGALGGFFINLSCYVLGRFFGHWMGPRAIRNERIVLAGVYFVGGWLGFAFATVVAASVSLLPLRTIRVLLPYFGLVSGGAAIVVGLLFYTFGVLQERLRESVERLKESEFAEKELELARSIQRRLLPPQELEGETWRLAARNVAAHFVAGVSTTFFRSETARSESSSRTSPTRGSERASSWRRSRRSCLSLRRSGRPTRCCAS